MLELRFQGMDALFRVLYFLARQHHVVACAQGFVLHHARFAQDFVENAVEFADIFRLADLFRIATDLFVEVARAGRHLAQAVDEGHHHVLDRQLDVGQTVLELALLVDDFLQAARGVFQRALVERTGDQVLHGVDLAAQPAVVVQQLADVVQQQLEQAQQQFLLLGRVAAFQFDLVAQLLQAQGRFVQRVFRMRLLDGGAQGFGFFHQRGRARQQGGDGKAQGAAEQLAQGTRLFAVRQGRQFDAAAFLHLFLGQLRQGARIAVPVARFQCPLEAPAKVAQFARRFAHLGSELRQHVFRAALRRCAGRQHGCRRRRAVGRFADAGDFIVDVAVGAGRGGDAARRQAAKCFAGDIGRIHRRDGGGVRGASGSACWRRGQFTGHVGTAFLDISHYPHDRLVGKELIVREARGSPSNSPDASVHAVLAAWAATLPLFHQLVADGVMRQFGAVLEFHFDQQAGAVFADGFDGQFEFFGDGAHRLARGNHHQGLVFAV